MRIKGICKECFKVVNRIKITKDELELLLENKSLYKIAEQYNVSYRVIYNIMKDLNVIVKHRGGFWKRPSIPNKEDLEKDNLNLSKLEIIKKYKTSKPTLKNWLEYYNIKSANRQYWEIKRQEENIQRVRNSGLDFSKYGWSTEVSKILNKKCQNVFNWMKKYCPDIFETAYKKTDGVVMWRKVKRELIKKRIDIINNLNKTDDVWINIASELIGIRIRYVKEFMKKHMSEDYYKYFKEIK
jgi:transposase